MVPRASRGSIAADCTPVLEQLGNSNGGENLDAEERSILSLFGP